MTFNKEEAAMKVGSTAYSYRKYLTSGEMTLEGFLDKAVEIGLDCVDLTSYYFPALFSACRVQGKTAGCVLP